MIDVAVCFSGQMRTFVKNAEALMAMFKHATGGVPVSFFGALHWEDRVWAANWPWTAVTVMQMQSVPGYEAAPFGHPRAAVPHVAIWQQMQGILMVGQLVRSIEMVRGKRFDFIIRCRPDLFPAVNMESFHSLRHDFSIRRPAHDNWGGLNDRFAFGPSVLMEKYFEYPNYAAAALLDPKAKKVGPETILSRHLQREGVRTDFSRAVMLTNRGDTKDSPVYREDKGDSKDFGAEG